MVPQSQDSPQIQRHRRRSSQLQPRLLLFSRGLAAVSPPPGGAQKEEGDGHFRSEKRFALGFPERPLLRPVNHPLLRHPHSDSRVLLGRNLEQFLVHKLPQVLTTAATPRGRSKLAADEGGLRCTSLVGLGVLLLLFSSLLVISVLMDPRCS